jgi:hypothetical protein
MRADGRTFRWSVSGDALKAERHLGCEEAWVNNVKVALLPFAASQCGFALCQPHRLRPLILNILNVDMTVNLTVFRF